LWTLHIVRPADLDADGCQWTFWKHSQGAGIEIRAAHLKTLNVHVRGSQRSQQCRSGEEIELDGRIFVSRFPPPDSPLVMTAALHALAHDARHYLSERLSFGELTVSHLSAMLEMPPAAASNYVHVLERTGLVFSVSETSFDLVRPSLIEALKEHPVRRHHRDRAGADRFRRRA
jgi:DNA-binding transcriptional ArsR family regulator